jgi:hypothetical protein
MKKELNILKIPSVIICVLALVYSPLTLAKLVYPVADQKLKLDISKSGLNRISNPPYKIVQMTGDDSRYRMKSDQDGANIYFMPLTDVGSMIELSIKNNIGVVYDLELKVENISGQSISIDGSRKFNKRVLSSGKSQTAVKSASNNSEKRVLDYFEREDTRQMLKAMKLGRDDKFYVIDVNSNYKPVGASDTLAAFAINMKKIYKWQDLVGGVFLFKNETKSNQYLDIKSFARRFDNVVASYASSQIIPANSSSIIFIIQKQGGKS